MIIGKSRILELLEYYPENFDTEDLVYSIYLLEKLSDAEQNIENNQLLNQDEVYLEIGQWEKM